MDKTQFTGIVQKLSVVLRNRVPRIIQTEAAECGLACIAMVCGYFGMHIDLFNLRRQYGISSQGATLAQLMNIAASLRLKTRALSLDMNEIRELRTPCILHWDFNHFVVLVKVKRSSFVIHDPAFGRKVIGEKEFSQHFTGIALELWPEMDFVPVKQKSRVKLFALIMNVQGIKGFLLKIFSLSLVIEAINLLIPVGTQLVMDHVIVAKDNDLLALICIGLVFFILFKTFVGIIRTWLSIVIAALIDVQWRTGVFDHMMRLPLSYFEKRRLGDIQSRFGSLNTIQSTLTSNIVNSIIDGIMIIGLIIMMWLYGNWLLWVVLGFTTVYATMRAFTYSYYQQASEEKIVKDAKSSSHFMETLYGVTTLKALGLSDARSKFWLNLNIDAINASIKLTKLDMLFGGASAFINVIDQVAILWLGASMVIDSKMTLGMFVAFNAYRGLFSERASNLVDMALQLKILGLHNDRISDIVLSDTEKDMAVRSITRPNEAAQLEVKNIFFQYDPMTKPILNDVNIKVDAGESVAIVGPSGIGKTTLMKIMSGLLEPTRGIITINDIDIYSVGINNYRNAIACVLQEDKLFAGTIAENIASFSAIIDMEFITTCAQNANIHNDIIKMPMGYETLISELGGSLSGGQKQRLLIARALFRRPGILFMDEATSHLDSDNESYINQCISALNITRIIIAHRPSTIASADRVITL